MTRTEKHPAVYILTNKKNGTLYTGVTSDLANRIWEHKNNIFKGFTSRYNIHTLVWYEYLGTMDLAIAREKEIKKWERNWKISLIITDNPDWNDLSDEISR